MGEEGERNLKDHKIVYHSFTTTKRRKGTWSGLK